MLEFIFFTKKELLQRYFSKYYPLCVKDIAYYISKQHLSLAVSPKWEVTSYTIVQFCQIKTNKRLTKY